MATHHHRAISLGAAAAAIFRQPVDVAAALSALCQAKVQVSEEAEQAEKAEDADDQEAQEADMPVVVSCLPGLT